jgi:hypothetical protein
MVVTSQSPTYQFVRTLESADLVGKIERDLAAVVDEPDGAALRRRFLAIHRARVGFERRINSQLNAAAKALQNGIGKLSIPVSRAAIRLIVAKL